jgi:Cu-processing system permease protein
MRRILVVARDEYRRALETRWMLGFATVFAAFVLGLSYFGLAQSQEVGFQGFARVTFSLLNLVLFIVPLAGLMLGVTSLAGTGESLSLLLAQPVSRAEVIAGKFLGLTAAIGAAQALGLGGGGMVVALNAGADQVLGYAALCALSLVLGTLSISVSLLLATLWPERLRAISAALLLWLVLVVGYDLVVLGMTSVLRGVPLQVVLFPAMLLNPVDLTRVLTTLAVGSGALFGPTSAVLVKHFGSAGGLALAFAVLLFETAVPIALATRRFRTRDL